MIFGGCKWGGELLSTSRDYFQPRLLNGLLVIMTQNWIAVVKVLD